MATPLLTLSTLTHYPTIEIDGKPYRLKPADSLLLFTKMQLEDREQQLEQLVRKQDRTKDDERDASALIDTLCRMVLEAPAKVHNKLNDTQRMVIYETFMRLPRYRRPPTEVPPTALAQTAPKTASRRHGARSSRGSRASTAPAPVATGSRPPSALSERAS